MADACPYIDHVIVDTGNDALITAKLATRNYDAAIMSFSRFRGYKLLRQLNIPHKLAPNEKWFQYLYKHRISTALPEDKSS